MGKISKMTAAFSAAMLAASLVPLTASAAPTDGVQSNAVAAADSQPQEAKAWYVQVGIGQGGDGSEARPFNDFANAYRAASDGDTIVLMNTATIIDPDDGKTDGFFAMDKSLTITGIDGAGGLSVRPTLVLGADVVFDDIEFVATSTSLNGHALTMKNVKNYTQSSSRPTIYGGEADGITENPTRAGRGSVLRVENTAGTKVEFQDIYAGSQSGDYAGDVDIELLSGAKVLGTLSADGAAGKVQGQVTMNLGNVHVSTISSQRQPASPDGPRLACIGFNPSDPVSISGFAQVEFNRSNVKIDPAASENNGHVFLRSSSTLDASSSNAPLRVEKFTSDSSLVKLHEEGLLAVKGSFVGEFEMRTTEPYAADTSGLVAPDHAYVTVEGAANGTVRFKPYFTQQNYRLEKRQVGQGAQWVASSGVERPLVSIEIEGENRIEIKLGEVERGMRFGDADGAPLAYDPDFAIYVKGPDGKDFDSRILGVEQDVDDPTLLRFEILDESMEAGTYTLVFTDMVSGKTIEKPFEFFKNEAPGPGGGGGGGTDPDPAPDPDPNPEPGPDPEPEPAPQPGTPDAPTAPPAIDAPGHGDVCPSVAFADVEAGQWHHEAVDYAVWNGIMRGTSDAAFEPDSTTTRGMAVMVLWRMAGEPEPQDISAFSDVDRDAWYAKAVAWASEAGVAHGYGEAGAFFGPEDKVTREQLATFLMRFASYKGFDTSSHADLSVFGDASDIGAFARDALSWGVAQGLFKGIGETMTLAPQGDSTRAQMAAVMMRFCQAFLEA
ncbi:MAG: S-layer homology domain-containing protein [Slackia sp.]|nr:S-layer homology domain-containing protein [Slackia sp.]